MTVRIYNLRLFLVGGITVMFILPFDISIFQIFFHVHIVLLIRKKNIALLKLKKSGTDFLGKKTRNTSPDQDTRH